MSEELKQPVVIVNRPGAAGVGGHWRWSAPSGRLHDRTYSTPRPGRTLPSEPPQLANVVPVRGDVLPGHVDRERQFPRKQPG